MATVYQGTTDTFPDRNVRPWNFPGVRRIITAVFARGGYESACEDRQRWGILGIMVVLLSGMLSCCQ